MNFPKLERVHNPHFVSFWPRVIASWLDSLIEFFWVPLTLWFLAGSSLSTIISDFMNALGLIILPGIILVTVGKVYLLRMTGQTLGKMIVGIEVLNEKKETLTWKRVVFRELIGKTISNYVLAAGHLAVLYDQKHRAWHDHFVDSYVYEKNKNTAMGVIVMIVLLFVHGTILFASVGKFNNNFLPEIQKARQALLSDQINLE